MRELVVLALVAFCASCWVMFRPVASGQSGPADDRIRTIMERGALSCGAPEGAEAGGLEELGSRLASRLGVRLDLRTLPGESLLAALAQGAIDVVLWPPDPRRPCPSGPGFQVRGEGREPRIVLRSSDRTLAALVQGLEPRRAGGRAADERPAAPQPAEP